MKRIGFFLFFCILSLYGLAQAENDKDTLIILQDKINEFINEMNEVDKSMDFINEPPTLTPPVLSDTLRMPKFDLTPREEMPKISPYTFFGNPFGHDYIDGRACQINNTGILSGYHSFQGLPSIGEARNVGVMYTQRLNDFITVTGGVYAAKYNVYGVRFNDFGGKGKLSFRINDRMKINMFGTYSVYNGYGMTPASQLFMNQNSYGGTLEFKISDSFGIEAGAEREFNPMTRKWETHPIIMPVFYK